MSDEEQTAFLADQYTLNAGISSAALKLKAQGLLDKTDRTMLRITEAVAKGNTTWATTDVQAWLTYREALRPIASSGTGSIPSQPSYPANT